MTKLRGNYKIIGVEMTKQHPVAIYYRILIEDEHGKQWYIEAANMLYEAKLLEGKRSVKDILDTK